MWWRGTSPRGRRPRVCDLRGAIAPGEEESPRHLSQPQHMGHDDPSPPTGAPRAGQHRQPHRGVDGERDPDHLSLSVGAPTGREHHHAAERAIRGRRPQEPHPPIGAVFIRSRDDLRGASKDEIREAFGDRHRNQDERCREVVETDPEEKRHALLSSAVMHSVNSTRRIGAAAGPDVVGPRSRPADYLLPGSFRAMVRAL